MFYAVKKKTTLGKQQISVGVTYQLHSHDGASSHWHWNYALALLAAGPQEES